MLQYSRSILEFWPLGQNTIVMYHACGKGLQRNPIVFCDFCLHLEVKSVVATSKLNLFFGCSQKFAISPQ